MLADRATKLIPPRRNDVRTYKGIGVSPGIAIGRAVIIERREASVFRVPIREEDVESEVNRFLESLEKTRDELAELKQKVSRPMGGFATEAGGRTSHTSIIAKSLFMPAVIGVHRLTKMIDNDEMVIVDGYEGTLIVNPTQAMIAEYQSRVLRHEEAERKLLENRTQPAITKDNHRITLQANIELVEELKDAVRFGAEGKIGRAHV